jgi:class 3 adenylate cyclase/tetratricopeptide (TPR) repeat protein
LVKTCLSCGEENSDRARFCQACTAPLAEARERALEERKVVTVLFCDLVGFTAASDQADPEDVKARLGPYHARLRAEIERFGGTVEKFIGDAIMAVFGAPVVHEDDAERAVRAALRIVEAIDEMNEAGPSLGLQVRIGINTGEAIVALGARPERGEGIVAGDVVNTAARLQQAAPVGATVVGEVTYRSTRDTIDYEKLPPVEVKGKHEPLSVWRATVPRTRLPMEGDVVPATPFIGRQDDLAVLRQTYARSVRESSAQLVTVTGEPGVGKSRLLSEFRASLDAEPEPVWWRQGRCLPYGEGITYWALGEIVKAHAGILESDSPELAAQKLESAIPRAIEDAPDREWMRARLAPLVGARAPESGGTVEREEYFTAWRRFLEAIAAEHPLILVFDDVHWADEPMLDFIEHLVDWSTGVPVLVIAAARPEHYERRPGWGGGKRNWATIALGPLSPDETGRLIAALLTEAVLPVETQAILLDQAGGNPLYAEQFVRMLTDRGILQRRGRTVALAAGMEIPVPETVQALIAARLDTLPSDRKKLLFDAAVVGKVFWTGVVSFMGGIEPGTVKEGLHELARKELVRPVRTSSVKDESEYSFWHLLVRDVAYGMIPRAARAAKHRMAAQWIERIAGERVADVAEVLAHHYSQALELARASGAVDAEGLEQAARRFLVLAGDHAVQLDLASAESYYRRALRILPAGHQDRAAVLAKAAECAWQTGRYSEAEGDYQEVIGALRAQGDELAAADAMVSLALGHWLWGKTAQSRRLTEEAVEILEREPPGPELARAYTQIARSTWLTGLARESLEWSSKALRLGEELGIREVAVIALQMRGGARCELGDMGGLEDLRQGLQMSLEYGLGQETVRGQMNLAEWLWWTEGPARGLEVIRAVVEFGERRGIAALALSVKAWIIWMLFELGEWDELLQVSDDVIAGDREHGGSYFGVAALIYRAQVLALRGQLDEAKKLEDEFLPRAREIGDPQILFPALTTGALIDLALGDGAAALRLVEEFEHVSRGNPHFRTLHVHSAARVGNGLRADDLGRRLLEGCSPIAARHQCCIVTAEANLTEAEGGLEQALELYVTAAERWAQFGHVPERGQALLGAGRCLLSLGRPTEAAAKLREASEVYRGLGARTLLDEVDALLGRATALPS